MMHRSIPVCLLMVAVTAVGVFGLAQDPTATPTLSTSKPSKQRMMPALDWVPFSTHAPVPIAIRIRSAERPASSRNCGSVIWMPVAIS